MLDRKCKNCGNSFKIKPYIAKVKGWGFYCSRKCANSTPLKVRTGKHSHNWKRKVGYYAVHDWLALNFGKANRCELCGKTKNVQWAKIKGKSYLRKRENFWQLCSRCHIYYDGTINNLKHK